MTAASYRARDRKHALTLWELARLEEQATFDHFARIVGAVRGTEAGKRAFYRFAQWCEARGVPVAMDENAASFDRKKALELALRVRPALRPRPPRTKTTPNAPQSTKGLERLVSVKEAARAIGMRAEFVRALLRRKPPAISFVLIGRRKVIRPSALEAWIKRNTVKGQEDAP